MLPFYEKQIQYYYGVEFETDESYLKTLSAHRKINHCRSRCNCCNKISRIICVKPESLYVWCENCW